MSLFRQLWIAVIGLTIMMILGSLLVSTLSARQYLSEQLALKNNDNAAALALSLSQLPEKDPVSIELLISAQFDTGHYQAIRLVDPMNNPIIEKAFAGERMGAPGWFVRLIPLESRPGVALVQDGWRQLGTLTVVSHSRFAYRELWQGAIKLFGWLLVAGLIAGWLGTLLIKLIVRPLNQVVDQARAISQRQFITLDEPRTPELRSVVRAMNDMVSRLKRMFAEEAGRLDVLRRQVNHDPITGLPNRDMFMNFMHSRLGQEEAAPMGALLLVRLSNLGDINRLVGHGEADLLIKKVSSVLSELSAQHDDRYAARLNGSDFILLIPNVEDVEGLAMEVADILKQRLVAGWPSLKDHFHVGAVRYQRGDHLGNLLSTADQALATAESKGPNTCFAKIDLDTPNARSAESWRELFTSALSDKRLKLALFPVHTTGGQALHQESVVRLQAEKDGAWLVAGDFIPMAIRLKLSASLDLEVIRLAIQTLETAPGEIAVNLSSDTIADWHFRNGLAELLEQHTALCSRLWFEVSEYGAFRQLDAFRDLARTLKKMGCRVGIEHAGHRLSELSDLADLGLDYIKVDSSLIKDIHQNTGNQEFLRGLCKMAHGVGMTIIAEGTQTADELSTLPQLGFDAATGPAVSKQQ